MTVHPNRASMIAAKTAKKLRAAIAATLCVVLLGETAFAYKPQTSLWTERKTTKPVVIASVAGAATPANPSALRRLISDIAPSSLTPASRSLSSRLPAGFLANRHRDRPGLLGRGGRHPEPRPAASSNRFDRWRRVRQHGP